MLNVGDKVFIAPYGGGIIRGIIKMNCSNIQKKYLKVFLYFDEMDLYIPIDKIDNYSIREITKSNELEEMLKIINEEPQKIQSNWSRRYRKNIRKLEGNNIKIILEVLRDLYYLKDNNIIPQGEKKILERAEGIVASEVMLSYNVTMEKAYEKIRNNDE